MSLAFDHAFCLVVTSTKRRSDLNCWVELGRRQRSRRPGHPQPAHSLGRTLPRTAPCPRPRRSRAQPAAARPPRRLAHDWRQSNRHRAPRLATPRKSRRVLALRRARSPHLGAHDNELAPQRPLVIGWNSPPNSSSSATHGPRQRGPRLSRSCEPSASSRSPAPREPGCHRTADRRSPMRLGSFTCTSTPDAVRPDRSPTPSRSPASRQRTNGKPRR
jgi:hypothetical protein